jgi:hypothetical protein
LDVHCNIHPDFRRFFLAKLIEQTLRLEFLSKPITQVGFSLPLRADWPIMARGQLTYEKKTRRKYEH